MRQSDKHHQILLIVILIIAAFLRFYHFFELPFMWDELSAWNRIQFNSFSELIEKGVKPDGHPAGVQVFLYYWTGLLGDQEWLIKLPFNLMGLASVWLVYRIGSIWFSKQSGLIASAFTASLQFFVLYSPIARPYSSGLFLSLLMVLFWSLYMFRTPKRIYLFGFIIFAALSAYNHHFSLLFAAIVGLSGLIVIPRNLLKEYIISGILIFILYLPHLNIFIHQLGVGGIGGEGLWLDKPDWSFVSDFFEWSFQYSILNYILLILFLILSIIYCSKYCVYKKGIKILILVIWFSFPLLIGLWYSIYINPVIQYSMLIFSFPYLLILISLFAGKTKSIPLYIIVFAVLSINIYQLIFARQHFKIIIKQPFDVTAQLAKEHPESSFVIFNNIPEYQHYYFNKYNLKDIPHLSIYKTTLSDVEIDSIAQNINEKYVITCDLPPHFYNIIQRHFPYFKEREDAYTKECYVFSKEQSLTDESFSKKNHFTNFIDIGENWYIDPNRIKKDSLSEAYFEFNHDQHWGFSLKDSIKYYSRNTIFDFQANIKLEDPEIEPIWVFSAYIGKTQLYWKGHKLSLLPTKHKNEYQSFFSVDSRMTNPKLWNDSVQWRLYIWNKNENQFNVSSVSAEYREANPIKYSLFAKIH